MPSNTDDVLKILPFMNMPSTPASRLRDHDC
jgi:hypothetical protein